MTTMESEPANTIRTIRANLDKLENLLPEPGKVTDADAYLYAARRYGIGYGNLRVECVINSDGSAQIIRSVTVDAYSKLSALDTFLLVPESPPQGGAWNLELSDADSANAKWTITAKEVKAESGRLSLALSIAPELNPGETLEYQLKESISTGLFAINFTPKQLEKRKSPLDYFGWHINRPTKRLDMHVYFPHGHARPSIFGREVRYASASAIPSVRRQNEEYQRLDGPYPSNAGGRNILELEVDYPMTGLIYMISWEPIPRTPTRRKGLKSKYEKETTKEIGVPPDVNSRLIATLVNCGPFDSNENLKSVFVDQRLTPWRNNVPDGMTTGSRAQSLINYLFTKFNKKGENALVLFLQVVAEQLDEDDACRGELETLVEELQNL